MTRIAVTSEGPSLDDRVDPRFGRAAGFLVVDLETMDIQYIDNGQSQVMAQGAGIKAAQLVARAGGSGKGGTGKTTVTASLATVWDAPLVAVDLDVEEPNLHLFLQPSIDGRETAHLTVPVVDEAKCTHCGACSDLCQFSA